MNWEALNTLLNVAEKLRGLPGYGNLLACATTEIGEMEKEAKEQVLEYAEKVKAEAAASAEKAAVEQMKKTEPLTATEPTIADRR